MDLQVLANFSSLIDQYKKAKETGSEKLQVLDKETCTLSVKTFNEQTGEVEWKFLGNLPVNAIDLIQTEKKKEITEIEKLKADMAILVKKG